MRNIITAEVNYTSALQINKNYFPITIVSGIQTFTVANGGTAPAPCKITLTPLNDIMTLTIKGLTDESIVVTKVKAGDAVVLDGINKQIKINGVDAFDRYNAWEFPRLKPGNNKIEITNADEMTLIEIEFQPRYI